MAPPDISVKIKCSNEAAFAVSVDPETSTVLDLKLKIAAHMGQSAGTDADASTVAAAESMRLIYSGKVLKDPDFLTVYKVVDGSTLHMVRGSQPHSAPSSTTTATANTPLPTTRQTEAAQPSGGAAPLPNLFGMGTAGQPGAAAANPFAALGGMGGHMGGMDNIMADPAMASMLGQMMSNPQFMDSLIAMNPQLSSMMTPQMRQVMQSDQFRAMLSNPQMMQAMMQMNAGAAGAGMGANPFTMFSQPSTTEIAVLLQMMMGGAGGMGAGGMGASGGQPTAPPEEIYQVQLRQLQDMGFYSASENVRALTVTGGNVEAAIEWLFSHPPGTQ
ncbi:hypothetical protein BASA50_003304 [Batrachochytrium salamandrivorans]|uniref:UBA domain-containing protein n=1 Tax=Batrachochytrium salamandrivorans TaxID=1357716 RepID=A0ABQ8FK18_9FUNG|nr:hypothetical protein BASA50_003304 [Batrachochytrium salamandrivorans]